MLFVVMRSSNHREQLVFLQSLLSSLFLLATLRPDFFPVCQLHQGKDLLRPPLFSDIWF